jgi:hypothetical protein
MPNFQSVIAKISLLEPCSRAVFPRYSLGEELNVKGQFSAAVIAGSSEYKITSTLKVIDAASCLIEKSTSASGVAAPSIPFSAELSSPWLPSAAGIYELRFEVGGAKKTGPNTYGESGLLALESCLFKVGDVPEVGAYLGWAFMAPCSPHTYGTSFAYQDNFDVRVLDDDPTEYSTRTRFRWWYPGDGGLYKDFPGTWNYGYKKIPGFYANQATGGGTWITDEPEVIVHTYEGFIYPTETGLSGISLSSPSPSISLCDGFRMKFFRVCVADIGMPDPFSSSSPTSSSPSM